MNMKDGGGRAASPSLLKTKRKIEMVHFFFKLRKLEADS